LVEMCFTSVPLEKFQLCDETLATVFVEDVSWWCPSGDLMKDMRSAEPCEGGVAKVEVDNSQLYCYWEGRESSDEALGIFVKQILKGLELLLELGNIPNGKAREIAALVKVRWSLR
jgi:hypothetical protein